MSGEAIRGGGVVRAFAPATVANVGCGFDVFGFAIDGPGDTVEVRRRAEPGVVIVDVSGDGGVLPREADRNTAAVAVSSLLSMAEADFGVEIAVEKGMPLASGLGSSAASGVAGVVAANELLSRPLPLEALLRCAVEGERVACGSAHADNVAPSLYRGFVLVRGSDNARIDAIPVPEDLEVALVHPQVEIPTGEARSVLPHEVPLTDAITQWGNVAALVAGLFQSDWELIATALEDVIVEPLRSGRVPGFAAAKEAALEAEGRVAADRLVSGVGTAAARVLDGARA